MKKLYNKIIDKNEYYDDLLEMIVTENKYRIWSVRILFLVFAAAGMLFLIQRLF